MAKCPECGSVLDIVEDEVEEGEIYACLECEAQLEVVSLHPIELKVLDDNDDEEDEDSDNEDKAEDKEDEEDEEEE